jgi:hypothetical protein
MPASLPGASLAQNRANPSQGKPVIFSLFSGPKGSPFDRAGSDTPSTGALSTGIGFGENLVISPFGILGTKSQSFSDDYTLGVTRPNGVAATDSTLVAIGGGKSTANVGGVAPTVPYTAGFGIGGAGNGGSRDAGAGPAFTGFQMKTVTAVAPVANGAAVEAGFLNRVGFTIGTTDSVFGSFVAASAAVA